MYRLLFLIFIFFTLKASALDVVYPSSKSFSTSAQSIFIHGNVNPDSSLKINSKQAKIWDNRFFVEVVNLNVGLNNIKVVETLKNGTKQEKIFTVKRTSSSSSTSAAPSSNNNFISKQSGTYLYSKVVKNNAVVRNKPSSNSTRLFELQKDTVLYLLGSCGSFYKIEEQGESEYWISKDNLSKPLVLNERKLPQIINQSRYDDEYYDYLKITLSEPVMYQLKQFGDILKLTLFSVVKADYSKSINSEFLLHMKKPILGYEAYYQGNDLIIKVAKTPKINKDKPLENIRIFIDPGHGGAQTGALGPTRALEKNINLAISKKLIAMLKAQGAIVTTSRTDDRLVGLYQRVNQAKAYNALISISIHNNSLPLGYNPYEKHGTGVYYYNENAKELGRIVKNNLVKDLNLKDDGLNQKSFALTRSTNPISILVEVAYMINPEEYKKIRTDDFQTKAAQSIKKSLEEYLRTF